MNILVKTIITILGTAFFSVVMALGTTTTTGSTNTGHSLMMFQVIQSQMIFDSSTVESAAIISPENTDVVK